MAGDGSNSTHLWDRLLGRLADIDFALHFGSVVLFADLYLAHAKNFSIIGIEWQWLVAHTSLGGSIGFLLALSIFMSVIAPALRYVATWCLVGVHSRWEYQLHGQVRRIASTDDAAEQTMRRLFVAALLIVGNALGGKLGYPTLLAAIETLAYQAPWLVRVAALVGLTAACFIAWAGLWLGTKIVGAANEPAPASTPSSTEAS
ncbi:MAG: hypothetical protein IPO08_05800 [Xanthomonadales bacterium]|nr:hypothetical protein [Xanthomonadales bacterium]